MAQREHPQLPTIGASEWSFWPKVRLSCEQQEVPADNSREAVGMANTDGDADSYNSWSNEEVGYVNYDWTVGNY